MNYENILSKYSTPLFIYDCDKLEQRVNYLKNMLDTDLCYAIKANSFVIKEIEPLVSRIEICSYGEYMICKDNGVKNDKMVLSGVNKNYDEFEKIIKEENNILRYTIESITQFNMLKELSNKYKKNINILPRITSGNQFGITKEELYYIIENLTEFMTLTGIEFFSGTQKHSIKRIVNEFTLVNEIFDYIKNTYKLTDLELEYGPGLPVYYFEEESFNEEEFLNEVKNNIHTFFKGRKVILEIGRSLVANCGEYITKVVDLKENKTGKYAIIDGGINHLVYYGGTMGMMRPKFEILNKSNTKENIYNIFGSLCTINDIIVKNVSLPELEINDTFVFKNTGAYSVTEGINLFLSRDMPKVLLLKNKNVLLVRDNINTYKLNSPNYGGK